MPALSKKSVPNPIDLYVGGRVRMRRMLVGISQEKLGESLGLTFQQVQKYEKGANRIGASRLYQIAHILGVPVEFFYDGLQFDGQAEASGFADAEAGGFELDMLSTSEGIQLNSAFFSIRDPKVRKKVLELIRALGEAAEANEDVPEESRIALSD